KEAPADQDVKVQLEHVTTYLDGNLLRLAASATPGEGRNTLPVRCTAKNCLFVPTTSSASLLSLKIPGLDAETLKDRLVWDAANSVNAYGYMTLVELESPGGVPTSMDMDHWTKFAQNEQSKPRAQLAEPGPTEPASFAVLPPERLAPDRSRVPEGVGVT